VTTADSVEVTVVLVPVGVVTSAKQRDRQSTCLKK